MTPPTSPANPTRSDLLERHWLEFLQHVNAHGKPPLADWESSFWWWYLEFKMEEPDA